MNKFSSIPENIVINGVVHILIEERMNFHYRALVLPMNGGDPIWLSDEDVIKLGDS